MFDAIGPDRLPNPHVAFGGGIHRCLGAHIARSEMRVRLEEFLSAVPPFRMSDAAVTTWKPGPIRGPEAVTLAITAMSRRQQSTRIECLFVCRYPRGRSN
jgi:hypothetical protein